MATLVQQIQSNKRKSVLLIGGFVLFVGIVALAFNFYFKGGVVGVVVALGITLGSTLISYWSSDKIALAMSNAKPADPTKYAQLHNIVEELSIAAGLPKPRVYVVQDPAPNAFATGRNPENAAVAVTTGLLDLMNRDELQGVMAHELAHIKDYDILVSTVAVTMVGLIALLADWGSHLLFFRDSDSNSNRSGPFGAILAIAAIALIILSPLIAQLMQAAVSRRRESLADAQGAYLTRYPQGLLSALEKLRDDSSVVKFQSRATAHLWFEAPLEQGEKNGHKNRLNNMFNTHPPLEERIANLQAMINSGRF